MTDRRHSTLRSTRKCSLDRHLQSNQAARSVQFV